MKTTKTLLSFFIVLSCTWTAFGQNLSAKIVDSLTQKPIPYVTVRLNTQGVITNEEGQFNFLLNESIKATDTLHISCIGYESLSRPIEAFTENIIPLSPKAIELREVIVSNKNYTANEIMEFVSENLERNHGNALTKKRVFHRQSQFNNWSKSDFTVKKSTIAVLDQRFLDSIITEIPKSDSYYSEVLGDLYGDYDTDTQKLDILKASKLYDKNTEMDAEKLQEKFIGILRENIKEGSYFKIKSGLLSFKIDADEVSELFEQQADSVETAALKKEIEDAKKDKADERENYGKWKKNKLGALMASLPTAPDTDLTFISKTRKYEYTLKAFTYMGNDAVYVIEFAPKGGADYQGILHINADDFALLQVQFENVKPLRKFNLLGISVNRYLSKGRILYTKGAKGHYGLKFYQSETAARVGIDRSLKIFEKNKIVRGRNKQNELTGNMDFTFANVEKNEVVVFETEPITKTYFEAMTTENDILPEYMAHYDPEFWKGHTIMEPNTAIREFTSSAQQGQ